MSGSCGWVAQSLSGVSQAFCEAVSVRLPENRCKWPLRVFVVVTCVARGCSLVPQRPTRALMGLAAVVELCWARRTSQGFSEGIVQSLCNTYKTFDEFVNAKLPESRYGWPVRATWIAAHAANCWFFLSLKTCIGLTASFLILENFWCNARYRSAVADEQELYQRLQSLEKLCENSSRDLERLGKRYEKFRKHLIAIKQCDDLTRALLSLYDSFEIFVQQVSTISIEERNTYLQRHELLLASHRRNFQALARTVVRTTVLYQSTGLWLQLLENRFLEIQIFLQRSARLTPSHELN